MFDRPETQTVFFTQRLDVHSEKKKKLSSTKILKLEVLKLREVAVNRCFRAEKPLTAHFIHFS